MNMQNNIPQQNEGGKSDAIASVLLNNETEARECFTIACARLRNVNDWEQVCGSDATNFALINAAGEPVQRDARPGDYFRIDIPGPGNNAGQGYDWVRVEEVKSEEHDDEAVFFMRVRPAGPPDTAKHEAAHFFKPEASSTFMVTRQGNRVTAGVHGRNEKPNTETEHFTDKLRNAVVGTASLLGFSYPQWKMLVNGLVKR